MAKIKNLNTGIPISISLTPTLEAENVQPEKIKNKARLLTIALLAVMVAVFVSFIAKLLVYLSTCLPIFRFMAIFR